jgi:hypothetical protein
MNLSANFHDYEFRCKCGCGGLKLHPGFLDRLQSARDTVFAMTGKGIKVLSGCRCKVHNDTPASAGGAGGHPRSLHVFDFPQHPGQDGCLAVDCEAVDGAYRGALITALWTNGFSVGWNAKRGFIHGDMRILLGLPQTTFDYT